MLSFAPDYDNLPLIAKVEVFEYALDNTEGNDLARVWNENSSYQYFFLLSRGHYFSAPSYVFC
jgi:FKBP12-rapamycin complex-associated protein